VSRVSAVAVLSQCWVQVPLKDLPNYFVAGAKCWLGLTVTPEAVAGDPCFGDPWAPFVYHSFNLTWNVALILLLAHVRKPGRVAPDHPTHSSPNDGWFVCHGAGRSNIDVYHEHSEVSIGACERFGRRERVCYMKRKC